MVPYGTTPSEVRVGSDVVTRKLVRTSEVVSLDLTSSSLAVGFSRRFDAILFWLSGQGAYTDLTWECSTAVHPVSDPATLMDGQVSTWTEIVPIEMFEWDFTQLQGYARFDINGPGLVDWVPGKYAAEADGASLYWIRVRDAGATMQRAKLIGLSIRPYTSVGFPEGVQAQLQYETPFSALTIPTLQTVERFIRGAEDDLFYLTGHYFRPEFVAEEQLEFRAYGMTLRHRPVLDILRLEVWNGNNWEEKIEGRDYDWHYEKHTGLIYISTIFLDVVPPILRRGYSARRHQGAFRKAVRVHYVHGQDARVDPLATEMGRMVVKAASADLMMNRDFQALIPQSLDRVPVQEKVRLWREEVQEFRERYAKLVMF